MTKWKSPLTDLVLVASALILVTVAGGAAMVRFDPTSRAGAQPMPPPPPPPPGMMGLAGPVLDQLGLAESQRTRIQAIRDESRTVEEPYLEQMRTFEKAVRAQIESDSFDENAVRALAMDVTQATIELTVIHARTDAAIYQLLTPEQRTRVAALRPPPPGR